MYCQRIANIRTDFINGYLTPIALMMDYVTPEVSFDYYFQHLQGDCLGNNLTETVRGMLERSFLNYKDRRGKLHYKTERINQLVGGCSLARMDDWKTDLPAQVSRWIGGPFTGKLKSAGAWPTSFLTDDFVDVLSQFFGETTAECWTIDGEIKNELYLHWGGCDYDDFFFESNGQFYHLHFDLCD